MNELRELAERYPGVLIYMVDNIFLGFSRDGSHLERGRHIARAIVEEGIHIRFVIQDRAANVDRETFAMLKSAGLVEVYLGIESFADSALHVFRKGRDSSKETNLAALRILGDLQIYTQFGFLPFHEKVTLTELRISLAGLRAACQYTGFIHVSNFNELIPYEGSYLARRYLRDHGTPPPDLDPWTYSDPRIKVVRDWVWKFSTALWPVTGLIFNTIQQLRYQESLHLTLPTKNKAFVDYCFGVLDQVEDASDVTVLEQHYQTSVSAAKQSIARTLTAWPSGTARDEVAAAVDLVQG